VKKRTAFVDALMSLLPVGQTLGVGTSAVLTSSALILSTSKEANNYLPFLNSDQFLHQNPQASRH
tara:strand:+ start:351 stop:545 length:195 start_codon:yes stop_codon:yes gene_type:complete